LADNKSASIVDLFLETPMKSVNKEAIRKAMLEAAAIAIGFFAALFAE